MRLFHGRKNRWVLYLTDSLNIKLEVGRARGLRWANLRYGGQESFGVISAGLGWGFWLALDTPFRWHRIRPRDGKYGESCAEFGLQWSRGSLRLSLGHDPRGSWYGGGHRQRWLRALRQTWKNRQLTLWDNQWVAGRMKSTWVDVAEFPYVLDVGQWDGDRYVGTMKLRRLDWRRRFRSGQRWDWEFEMPSPGKGIPIPGNIDSDFYDGDDGIFSFGVSADRMTLEEAAASLRACVVKDRGSWRPVPSR